MSGLELLAILCGVGTALCWGDPDQAVSRQLGWSGARRGGVGLALLLLGAGMWLFPAWRAATVKTPAADWTLVRLADGKATSLNKFRGKTVVLNLWATWCPPCLSEMPSLLKLRDRLKDRPDVEFVFAAVNSRPAEVAELLKARGWDLPTYFPEGPPPGAFRTEGIPATFFIDRNGRVARTKVGAEEWDAPRWEAELRQLADVPPLPAETGTSP